MKKLSALLLILALSFSACFAATTVTKTTSKKPIFGSAGNKTVVKTVAVKRYYYSKTTVVIAKKTVVYHPWKWLGTVKVVVNKAVILAHPDHRAALVMNLKMGSEYQALRRVGSWFFIKADGKEGWVHKDSVKVIKIEKNVKPAWGENLEEVNASEEAK